MYGVNNCEDEPLVTTAGATKQANKLVYLTGAILFAACIIASLPLAITVAVIFYENRDDKNSTAVNAATGKLSAECHFRVLQSGTLIFTNYLFKGRTLKVHFTMTSFYYVAYYMYLRPKSFKILLDRAINREEKCDVTLPWQQNYLS